MRPCILKNICINKNKLKSKICVHFGLFSRFISLALFPCVIHDAAATILRLFYTDLCGLSIAKWPWRAMFVYLIWIVNFVFEQRTFFRLLHFFSVSLFLSRLCAPFSISFFYFYVFAFKMEKHALFMTSTSNLFSPLCCLFRHNRFFTLSLSLWLSLAVCFGVCLPTFFCCAFAGCFPLTLKWFYVYRYCTVCILYTFEIWH